MLILSFCLTYNYFTFCYLIGIEHFPDGKWLYFDIAVEWTMVSSTILQVIMVTFCAARWEK